MTICSIIDDALQTRVLTSRQQYHINTLLLRCQYSQEDFEALQILYSEMSSGRVVSGGDSLALVYSVC